MAGGRLQADPLFQGLTRPAMILGVSYMYFVLNASLSMVVYINTTNVVVILVIAPIIHAAGYMICLKEPRAVELLAVRFGKTMRCKGKNKIFHGFTNSYDVF